MLTICSKNGAKRQCKKIILLTFDCFNFD